jgi:hypothetical protein
MPPEDRSSDELERAFEGAETEELPIERTPSRGRKLPGMKSPGNLLPRPDLERPALDLGKKPVTAMPAQGSGARDARAGRAITPDEIRAVVGRNESEVKSCYRGLPAVTAGTNRSKKLEVALTVEPSGQVSHATVRASGPSPESDCIRNKARGWKFSPPGGELSQEIVVPFVIVLGTA